jgi:hypothetical protein
MYAGILQLKETLNTMVDQLRAFASEVTRVQGKSEPMVNWADRHLCQELPGTWKDLTDSVNK